MKMWIDGKEWIWNERERRLKDKAGNGQREEGEKRGKLEKENRRKEVKIEGIEGRRKETMPR